MSSWTNRWVRCEKRAKSERVACGGGGRDELRRVALGTLIAILIASSLTFSAVADAQSGNLVLEGGTLVDVERGELVPATLWIREGVIVAVGDGPPPGIGDFGDLDDFDGETLDVTGQFVLPGLRDMHVHAVVNQSFGAQEMLGPGKIAERSLYSGVVGVLDLLNTENFIFGFRNRQRAQPQGSPGAELFAAGAVITAPGGHGTEYPAPAREVTSPKEARQQVNDLASKSPDVVKIIYDRLTPEQAEATWRKPRPSIDEPTLEAAIKAAAKAGIPTVVHIRTWENVIDAAKAGATAVTHLPSTTAPPEAVALLAERGTFVIPTLAVADPSFVTRPEALDSALLRQVTSPAIIEAYRNFDTSSNGMAAGLTEAMTHRFQSLRLLSEAGIKLAAGTDAGNVLTVHGYSLHRELALLVDAGLTPWQALSSATINAGELLGRRWGLRVGDEGTVVVLGASPIEDIRNSETIEHVIQRGVVVDREVLLGH